MNGTRRARKVSYAELDGFRSPDSADAVSDWAVRNIMNAGVTPKRTYAGFEPYNVDYGAVEYAAAAATPARAYIAPDAAAPRSATVAEINRSSTAPASYAVLPRSGATAAPNPVAVAPAPAYDPSWAQIPIPSTYGSSYRREATTTLPANVAGQFAEGKPRLTEPVTVFSRTIRPANEPVASATILPPAKMELAYGLPPDRPELQKPWFASTDVYKADCSRGLAKNLTKTEAVQLAHYLHPTISIDILQNATKTNLCALVSDEIVTAVVTALTEDALSRASKERLVRIAQLANPRIPAAEIARLPNSELREAVARSLDANDQGRILGAWWDGAKALGSSIQHGWEGTSNAIKYMAALKKARETTGRVDEVARAILGLAPDGPRPASAGHLVGAGRVTRPKSAWARRMRAAYYLDRSARFAKSLRYVAPNSAVCRPRVRLLTSAATRRGVSLCG